MNYIFIVVQLCTLVCTVTAPVPPGRSVNLNLETVMTFDRKNLDGDVKIIKNVQDFLSKVRNVLDETKAPAKRSFGDNRIDGDIKFTGFLEHVIRHMLTYSDDELEKIAYIIDDEFRKYHYKGCKFYELLENNDELRYYVTDLLEQMKRLQGNKLRNLLMRYAKKIQENDFTRKDLAMIEYINSLYNEESQNNMNRILTELDDFRNPSRRTQTNLIKVIRKGLRSIIFNHYSKLNKDSRRDIKMKIASYVVEYLPKGQKGKGKIITYGTVTVFDYVTKKGIRKSGKHHFIRNLEHNTAIETNDQRSYPERDLEAEKNKMPLRFISLYPEEIPTTKKHKIKKQHTSNFKHKEKTPKKRPKKLERKKTSKENAEVVEGSLEIEDKPAIKAKIDESSTEQNTKSKLESSVEEYNKPKPKSEETERSSEHDIVTKEKSKKKYSSLEEVEHDIVTKKKSKKKDSSSEEVLNKLTSMKAKSYSSHETKPKIKSKKIKNSLEYNTNTRNSKEVESSFEKKTRFEIKSNEVKSSVEHETNPKNKFKIVESSIELEKKHKSNTDKVKGSFEQEKKSTMKYSEVGSSLEHDTRPKIKSKKVKSALKHKNKSKIKSKKVANSLKHHTKSKIKSKKLASSVEYETKSKIKSKKRDSSLEREKKLKFKSKKVKSSLERKNKAKVKSKKGERLSDHETEPEIKSKEVSSLERPKLLQTDSKKQVNIVRPKTVMVVSEGRPLRELLTGHNSIIQKMNSRAPQSFQESRSQQSFEKEVSRSKTSKKRNRGERLKKQRHDSKRVKPVDQVNKSAQNKKQTIKDDYRISGSNEREKPLETESVDQQKSIKPINMEEHSRYKLRAKKASTEEHATKQVKPPKSFPRAKSKRSEARAIRRKAAHKRAYFKGDSRRSVAGETVQKEPSGFKKDSLAGRPKYQKNHHHHNTPKKIETNDVASDAMLSKIDTIEKKLDDVMSKLNEHTVNNKNRRRHPPPQKWESSRRTTNDTSIFSLSKNDIEEVKVHLLNTKITTNRIDPLENTPAKSKVQKSNTKNNYEVGEHNNESHKNTVQSVNYKTNDKIQTAESSENKIFIQTSDTLNHNKGSKESSDGLINKDIVVHGRKEGSLLLDIEDVIANNKSSKVSQRLQVESLAPKMYKENESTRKTINNSITTEIKVRPNKDSKTSISDVNTFMKKYKILWDHAVNLIKKDDHLIKTNKSIKTIPSKNQDIVISNENLNSGIKSVNNKVQKGITTNKEKYFRASDDIDEDKNKATNKDKQSTNDTIKIKDSDDIAKSTKKDKYLGGEDKKSKANNDNFLTTNVSSVAYNTMKDNSDQITISTKKERYFRASDGEDEDKKRKADNDNFLMLNVSNASYNAITKDHFDQIGISTKNVRYFRSSDGEDGDKTSTGNEDKFLTTDKVSSASSDNVITPTTATTMHKYFRASKDDRHEDEKSNEESKFENENASSKIKNHDKDTSSESNPKTTAVNTTMNATKTNLLNFSLNKDSIGNINATEDKKDDSSTKQTTITNNTSNSTSDILSTAESTKSVSEFTSAFGNITSVTTVTTVTKLP